MIGVVFDATDYYLNYAIPGNYYAWGLIDPLLLRDHFCRLCGPFTDDCEMKTNLKANCPIVEDGAVGYSYILRNMITSYLCRDRRLSLAYDLCHQSIARFSSTRFVQRHDLVYVLQDHHR